MKTLLISTALVLGFSAFGLTFAGQDPSVTFQIQRTIQAKQARRADSDRLLTHESAIKATRRVSVSRTNTGFRIDNCVST